MDVMFAQNLNLSLGKLLNKWKQHVLSVRYKFVSYPGLFRIILLKSKAAIAANGCESPTIFTL